VELNIIQRRDHLTQVALSGRLDATGVQEVETRFHDATVSRGKPTIIDLTDLEFIASLGLGMLLSCARSLRALGADVVIVNPQPLVQRSLETAHMHSVVPVVSSIAEAEAALK